jgi:hypothetical protein
MEAIQKEVLYIEGKKNQYNEMRKKADSLREELK